MLNGQRKWASYDFFHHCYLVMKNKQEKQLPRCLFSSHNIIFMINVDWRSHVYIEVDTSYYVALLIFRNVHIEYCLFSLIQFLWRIYGWSIKKTWISSCCKNKKLLYDLSQCKWIAVIPFPCYLRKVHIMKIIFSAKKMKSIAFSKCKVETY